MACAETLNRLAPLLQTAATSTWRTSSELTARTRRCLRRGTRCLRLAPRRAAFFSASHLASTHRLLQAHVDDTFDQEGVLLKPLKRSGSASTDEGAPVDAVEAHAAAAESAHAAKERGETACA